MPPYRGGDQLTTDDVEPGDAGIAEWRLPSPGEPRWPASLAVVLALAIYVRLPDRLTPGPQYLVPVLELALLIPLVVAHPRRIGPGSKDLRWLSLTLIAFVLAANAGSLILLVRYLLHGGKANGRQLFDSPGGSYLERVWVSPSSFRRVLADQGLRLDPLPRPGRSVRKPFPDWVEYRPNAIWIYDTTHFTRPGWR